ncbi:MAG: radical SAM protein, partial [Melioribacter sp.]|nr:radical SAM protein [Melioribacter sp.]
QFGMPSNGIKTDWKWRPFPIETVLKNIESYALQGVRIFDIKDSEFFGPVRKVGSNDPFKSTMERVMKFSNGIIQLNKKLPQRIKINHISCRVDTIFSEGEIEKNKIRLEAFKMLKDVGVESIFVGIESGSSNQLKRYCKGVTVNENENALRILTTLGFKIEPGFIMFDPIVTLDELKENIDFIERTNLYQYDSHILGSLRLQNGSPYIKLTDSKGLLLNQNDDSLTYNYNFMNDDVRMIEATFSQYESIARKLPKFLSVNLRLKGYKNDFNLLKGLIVNYGHNARLENTLAEYLIVTEQMLESAKYDIEMCVRGSENLNLSREYLEQSRNNLDIFKRTRHTKTIGQKKLRLNTLSKNNFYPMVNIKPEFTSQHHYM